MKIGEYMIRRRYVSAIRCYDGVLKNIDREIRRLKKQIEDAASKNNQELYQSFLDHWISFRDNIETAKGKYEISH